MSEKRSVSLKRETGKKASQPCQKKGEAVEKQKHNHLWRDIIGLILDPILPSDVGEHLVDRLSEQGSHPAPGGTRHMHTCAAQAPGCCLGCTVSNAMGLVIFVI